MRKPADIKARANPSGYVDDPEAVGDVSPWRMTWTLLTSKETFAAAEAEHIAFAKERMRRLVGPRTGPHLYSPEGQRFGAFEAATRVRAACSRTLVLSLITLAVALLLALLLGVVAPNLPWHWGKVSETAGAVFALWGTLLALNGPYRSAESGTEAAKAHALLFTILLGIGGASAMFGTLISP
jgi:hypothetical protein